MTTPVEARVYLVEPHPQVRQALAQHLRALTGIAVVGATGDAEQALAEVHNLRPQLVVVETRRTDGQGWNLLRHLARECAVRGLIVLTAVHSEWESREAHRIGAAYLLKDLGTPALERAIRQAVA